MLNLLIGEVAVQDKTSNVQFKSIEILKNNNKSQWILTPRKIMKFKIRKKTEKYLYNQNKNVLFKINLVQTT